jgi:hypothetical protein
MNTTIATQLPNYVAPVFNSNGISATTSQITDFANVFGPIAIKIVLAGFFLYFFYLFLKVVSK